MVYRGRCALCGARPTLRRIHLFFCVGLVLAALPFGCLGFKRFHDHHETRAVSTRKQQQPQRSGRRNGALNRQIDAIFREADTNHDGAVEVDEAYPLVLKMYCFINRQAPVAPPTPEAVQRLFEAADADGNGRLDLDEFRRLLLSLSGQNTARVVAYKLFRLVGAPLLALRTFVAVTRFRSRRKLSHEFPILDYVPYVQQRYELHDFWKAATVVVYSVLLGSIALSIIDFILYRIQLSSERKKD